MNAEGRRKKEFDLEDRLVEFAADIIDVVEALPESRTGKHIAAQLVRSGTSPAPNYGEAQAAESSKDFIHKMKIALKELRETFVWLKIIRKKAMAELSRPIDECDQLIAIFVSSIQTAKANQ